jgi:diaminopimelate decarboxylase
MPCLVTGSKFFASAPFCGAVVLPAIMCDEIETHLKQSQLAGVPSMVPIGICEYLTIFDIPSSMVNLKSYLQTKPVWTNPGLTLRWWGGVTNMEAFCSLPSALVESFSRAWVDDVRKSVMGKSPFLELFDVSPGNYADQMLGEVNTIVSIIINVPDSARDGKLRRLSLDESKMFHRVMSVSTASSDDISQVQACIGQPVKLSSSSIVLRIALGADIVLSALGSSQNCDELALSSQISNVFAGNLLTVNKMHYIAKNWNTSVLEKMEHLASFLPSSESQKKFEFSPSVETFTRAFKLIPEPVNSTSIMYDLDSIDSAIFSCKNAFSVEGRSFGSNHIHCFAMKACPVSFICHHFIKAGMGIEAASMIELLQARRCGCPANKIVFDSPCKTVEDLEMALLEGVHVNANSYTEVEKINQTVRRLGDAVKGTVGMRINPLVGGGKIEALSTATASSKFGIPLTLESKERILKIFRDNSHFVGVMCHVGSQGMTLQTMAEGASSIIALADDIDAACARRPDGLGRITHVDIGGGLSSNYSSEVVTPAFSDYVAEIEKLAPNFMDTLAKKKRLLITEFGKALISKNCATVSLVEDVLKGRTETSDVYTAIIHMGADLFVRTAYRPDAFSHRLMLLDSSFDMKPGPTACVTVAGPLCFTGDILAKEVSLPVPSPGDHIIALDTGANTISTFSRHCSRPAPPVYCFRTKNGADPVVVQVKKPENKESVFQFWD